MAVAALLLLSFAETRRLAPARDLGVLPIDPPTPFFHFPASGSARGKILVVHGMDANKEFMQLLCAALSDGGFEVFAIDLPGHGASTVGFTAFRARDAVVRALDYLGIDVVVGHSLGAGLLLDIANSRTFQRMVLLSPAPTPVDHIDFSRTLVVTGAFDIPAINAFVPRLEGAERWRLPWGGHSSAVFDPNRAREMVAWLGGDAGRVLAAPRLRWNLLMLGSALVLGLCLIGGGLGSSAGLSLDRPPLLATVVLTSAASVVLLRFIPVMSWLHLFATDYLIGFFFVTGLMLCAIHYRSVAPFLLTPGARGFGRSLIASVYAIGVVGFFAAGAFSRFALSDGRWWRFPVIALAFLPFFYFDEIHTRESFITGALTRGVLGSALVMGVLTFNRTAGFLVLMIHLFIVFWIGLWSLAGVVRRRTGSPAAAALFSALVQAWLFAAWFITT